MSFDFKAAIKKPWVKYSLIGIAVLGVGYILMSRSSSGSTGSATDSSGATDAATVSANAQLSAQQAALSAQSASQESQQNFQLAGLKETDAFQLAALDKTNTANLALSQIQLTGLQSQLAEQSHVADLSAGVQNNNTNQAASVAKKTSDNSAIASGLGVAAMAVVALF